MKKKDILAMTISLIIIVIAIFYTLQLLFPPQTSNTINTNEAESIPKVSEPNDPETYKSIQDLSDYGVPAQTDIGKKDLFGDI